MKGIPISLGEHRIVLEASATPIRQRQHRLNPKYSLMVEEEIDKLLKAGFIYPVPYSEWVSPIVMVPKKNGKVRICQDFRKLTRQQKKIIFRYRLRTVFWMQLQDMNVILFLTDSQAIIRCV